MGAEPNGIIGEQLNVSMLQRAFDADFKEGFFLLIEKGAEINFKDFSNYISFFEDSAFIDARPELKKIINLRLRELTNVSINLSTNRDDFFIPINPIFINN